MNLLGILDKLPQTVYCSESLNIITNLAYLITGLLSYRLLKRVGIVDKQLLILPWLLVIVGVGSFSYHTFRNSLTHIFDAVPIYVFILLSLFLILKELFQSKSKALAVLLGFVVLQVILSIYIPQEFINGSIRHLVTIIFVSLMGIVVVNKYGSQVKAPLIAMLASYGVGILFRSVDMAMCLLIPIGTHFLWHIFTALAGYSAIVLLSKIKKGGN